MLVGIIRLRSFPQESYQTSGTRSESHKHTSGNPHEISELCMKFLVSVYSQYFDACSDCANCNIRSALINVSLDFIIFEMLRMSTRKPKVVFWWVSITSNATDRSSESES